MRKYKDWAAFLIPLLLTAGCKKPDDDKLVFRGRVVNKTTLQPLAGRVVSLSFMPGKTSMAILGPSAQRDYAQATTNSQGFYTLRAASHFIYDSSDYYTLVVMSENDKLGVPINQGGGIRYNTDKANKERNIKLDDIPVADWVEIDLSFFSKTTFDPFGSDNPRLEAQWIGSRFTEDILSINYHPTDTSYASIVLDAPDKGKVRLTGTVQGTPFAVESSFIDAKIGRQRYALEF